MLTIVRQQPYFFAALFAIYALAWWLQHLLLFNSDVSWLLLATKRLLAGGSYTQDFFEVNPPIILYLYTPAALLSLGLSLASPMALRLYVYALTTVVLYCCWQLWQPKSTRPSIPRSQQQLLLLTFASVFLFLPLSEFGQREHLALLLSTPYLLLLAQRLEARPLPSQGLLYCIGILAGCGFLSKPYFIVTPCLLEAYIAYRHQGVFRWRRPECLGMFIVCGMAALLLYWRNADYLTNVLPYITHFYYQKYGNSLVTLLKNPQTAFAAMTGLLYAVTYSRLPQRALCSIVMIAMLGWFIPFLLQQTTWYYHSLPFFSLCIVLTTFIFCTWVMQSPRDSAYDRRVGSVLLMMFAYELWQLHYIWLGIYFYALGYFGLFTLLFGFLYAIAYRQENRWYAALALVMTVLAGVGFRGYLQHTALQAHLFSLTTVLLLLIYSIFIPDKTPRGKARYMGFAFAGIILFAYPFYEVAYISTYALDYRNHYQTLLTTLRQYPLNTITVFSNSADFTFPAFDYTDHRLGSRFGCFGWLPALSYWDSAFDYSRAYQDRRQAMDFFTQAVASDLNRKKPHWVFVDRRNTNLNRIKTYFGGTQIDYVRFFSQNADFQVAWQPYHFVKMLDGQPLFKFAVYERRS